MYIYFFCRTHSWKLTGRQLDGVGNLKDWWDELTKKEFNTRSQCFVDQYSAIYVITLVIITLLKTESCLPRKSQLESKINRKRKERWIEKDNCKDKERGRDWERWKIAKDKVKDNGRERRKETKNIHKKRKKERESNIWIRKSALQVETAELHLNGKLELGENIADNGGVKQAHMVYFLFHFMLTWASSAFRW